MSGIVNIAIVSDDKVCITPDGSYYSNTGYNWIQFADLFGDIRVDIRIYCRTLMQPQPPDGWAPYALDERISVSPLPFFHKYQAVLQIPRAWLKLFREFRSADLAWLVVPNVYGTLGYLAARLRRRKVLAWCVGNVRESALMVYDELPLRLIYRSYAWMTRRIMHGADVPVVTSHTLLREYRLPGDTLIAYRAMHDPSYLGMDRHAVPSPVILYVGRLSAEKGVATLLQAFQAVSTQMEDSRLVLVGDGQERGNLEQQAKAAGIEAHVDFRGWVPHGPVLRQVYSEARVFCLPSHTEGMPAALVEAMWAGLPTVVTSVGDMPAVVNGAGTVVPPKDPESLSGALIELLSDERAYAAKSALTLKVAHANSLEVQTGKVVSQVVRLMGSDAGGKF